MDPLEKQEHAVPNKILAVLAGTADAIRKALTEVAKCGEKVDGNDAGFYSCTDSFRPHQANEFLQTTRSHKPETVSPNPEP